MKSKQKQNRQTLIGIFFPIGMIILSLCYLFFPTNNPSCDALCYAADVKYGTELFWAHHLLHNAFHFVVYKFCLLFGNIDAMVLMNVVTAVFAIATLWVTWRILSHLTEKNSAKMLVLFLGACYGFMRFSTQCETYVIPIFFSISASYFFCKFVEYKKLIFAILAGLMSALACLFHQVQVFWTIGLFVGFLCGKKYRAALVYFICLIIIPIVYSLAFVISEGGDFSLQNVIEYALSYYFSDNSSTGIGWKNLLMTPISFVRSIIQVHGNFALLLKIMPWLYAMFLLLPVMIFAIIKIFRNRRFTNNFKLFGYLHLSIFVMQFAFACFSDGNTEFMVMLPFALILGLAAIFYFPAKATLILASSLFVWNFAWAILPDHIFDYYNSEKVTLFLKQNPDTQFVATDEHIVENMYFYNYGELIENRVHSFDKEISTGEYVTDVIDRPAPLNRNTMLNDYSTENFTNVEPIFKIEADYGDYKLYRVNYKLKN